MRIFFLVFHKNLFLDELISRAYPFNVSLIQKLFPRESTVKPSDRRIDFDIETLCNFLERRKLSYSDHRQSPDEGGPGQSSEKSRQWKRAKPWEDDQRTIKIIAQEEYRTVWETTR